MKKLPQPAVKRSPISARELLLLAALVATGVLWYKEYERAQAMNVEMEMIKQRFGGMLELEDKLRQDPAQKSANLRVLETGGPPPHLRWSMEVSVIDESDSSPPSAADAATPKETVPKVTASKTAPKDTALKETAPKETAPKETGPKESAPKEPNEAK